MNRCKVCGAELDHDRHQFTDDKHPAEGVTMIREQYCDEHCPRCGVVYPTPTYSIP